MEAHLSNPVRVEPVARHYPQVFSLPAAAVAVGVVLTGGLLLFVLPFSDQIAISLSLLS